MKAIPYGPRGLLALGENDPKNWILLNFGEAPMLQVSDYSEAAVQSVADFLRFQKRRYRYLYDDYVLFPHGEDPPRVNGIFLKIRDIDTEMVQHPWFNNLMGEYLNNCTVTVSFWDEILNTVERDQVANTPTT